MKVITKLRIEFFLYKVLLILVIVGLVASAWVAFMLYSLAGQFPWSSVQYDPNDPALVMYGDMAFEIGKVTFTLIAAVYIVFYKLWLLSEEIPLCCSDEDDTEE